MPFKTICIYLQPNREEIRFFCFENTFNKHSIRDNESFHIKNTTLSEKKWEKSEDCVLRKKRMQEPHAQMPATQQTV